MIRRILLASLLPATLVTACGDDGGGGTITPAGAFHHYAVSGATIPKNSAEARMFGLDVDGKEGVDNQLGMVLGTLSQQGFNLQDPLDLAVAEGSLTLLFTLQTDKFDTSSGAGATILLGSNPMPAPCSTPDGEHTVATCGLQLKGTGMFTAGAQQGTIAGTIKNGVFNGGGLMDTITLKISLAGANIDLNLIAAKTQIQQMSEDKIDSLVVAGAVTQDDLNTKILPAIQAQISPLIARDCTALDMPNGTPACGCADGSTGKQVISLFDTSPKDCAVTVDEIKNNGLIQSLLAPDVTINGQMALSVGLKLKAVKGMYTDSAE